MEKRRVVAALLLAASHSGCGSGRGEFSPHADRPGLWRRRHASGRAVRRAADVRRRAERPRRTRRRLLRRGRRGDRLAGGLPGLGRQQREPGAGAHRHQQRRGALRPHRRPADAGEPSPGGGQDLLRTRGESDRLFRLGGLYGAAGSDDRRSLRRRHRPASRQRRAARPLDRRRHVDAGLHRRHGRHRRLRRRLRPDDAESRQQRRRHRAWSIPTTSSSMPSKPARPAAGPA